MEPQGYVERIMTLVDLAKEKLGTEDWETFCKDLRENLLEAEAIELDDDALWTGK